MSQVEIIAEIGTSHQGKLATALAMIDAAKEAGADTVKFQWVYADEIVHPATGTVALPGGKIALFERFRELEQGPDFFLRLKQHAESIDLSFLCSPFGIRSAQELLTIGAERFKIASPELNHLTLLEYCAYTHNELILSSGVSRLSDIEEALETVRLARAGQLQYLPLLHPSETMKLMRSKELTAPQSVVNDYGPLLPIERSQLKKITLLHCITSYPAPEDQYNLLLLRSLRQIFGVETGISDHSLDPILVPTISTVLGARMIEKHFTLSNDSSGLDDPIALNPQAFKKMTKSVREAEFVLKQTKTRDENNFELSSKLSAIFFVQKIFDELNIRFDEEKISAILGDGVKQLALAEQDNYGRSNRSLHAVKELQPNTIIKASDFAILRTEKLLRPGIHPRFLTKILGKELRRGIENGQGLVWADFL